VYIVYQSYFYYAGRSTKHMNLSLTEVNCVGLGDAI